MAMQAGLKVIIINRLSTDQHSCDEEVYFVRLAAILEKTVNKANKMHRDASGWYQIGTKS